MKNMLAIKDSLGSLSYLFLCLTMSRFLTYQPVIMVYHQMRLAGKSTIFIADFPSYINLRLYPFIEDFLSFIGVFHIFLSFRSGILGISQAATFNDTAGPTWDVAFQLQPRDWWTCRPRHRPLLVGTLIKNDPTKDTVDGRNPAPPWMVETL